MTEIVDAFVATLGLDSRQYNDEVKKYREDRKRLSEENEKYSRREEDAQSRSADGIRTLRNETAGFLLMLAGANSLQQFVGNMLSSDAATGRFARNIGMATERVGVWEEAVKQAGGQAGEASAALQTLYDIFQNKLLLGDNSKSGALAFFGLNENDLRNPEQALLRIAEVVKKLPREEVAKRLELLGLNGPIANLLAGDRGDLSTLLTQIEKTGVATDDSAKAAEDFDASLTQISQTIKSKARPAVKALADALSGTAENQEAVNAGMALGIGVLAAAGISAAVAAGPFIALAAAIAGVGYAVDSLVRSSPQLQSFLDGIEKPLKDWLGPDWAWLFERPGGSPYGGEVTDNADQQYLRDDFRSNFRGGKPVKGGKRNIPILTGDGAANGGGQRTAANVERYFRSKGFSAEQARGIAASVVAEGGLGMRTGGGYKGRALGIGQLLGSRRSAFLKRYGPNFTFQNELDFMYEEMNSGDGRFVADRIKRSGSSGAIARMMVDQFYRPLKGAQTIGDYQRAGRYLRQPVGVGSPRSMSQSNSTTIGQITVVTQATDAPGIARDLRAEIQKRGIVAQAGSGLRP